MTISQITLPKERHQKMRTEGQTFQEKGDSKLLKSKLRLAMQNSWSIVV
jgi:hypothetical protein